MAIKTGQIIHDADGFTLDRLQTAGISNLNIPEEKIYEIGNYQTVAIVRDIPDLSFDLQSVDVSTEVESLLLGKDPTAAVDGDEFDFLTSLPVDVISPFKESRGLFDITNGVAVPYLNLENITYRFGLRSNAEESFTLRGDSVYYIPGIPFYEEFAVSGTSYSLAHTALPYVEAGNTLHVLSVCLKNAATGKYKRLFFGSGADYTDSTTTLTLAATPDSAYNKIHVVYGVAKTANISYTQTGVNPQGNTVHEGTGVKPAAIRGKDLEVWVWDSRLATPALVKWAGVQSFEATRKVTLDNDEEFGNYHYVASDYDVADVTGNVVLKPFDTDDLMDKVRQVTNVPSGKISSTYTYTQLPMELRIKNPDTGAVLKTIYVPDAQFQVPAISSRANQKLTVTLTWSSPTGVMKVYKGSKA